jgi:hypothetical protein
MTHLYDLAKSIRDTPTPLPPPSVLLILNMLTLLCYKEEAGKEVCWLMNGL